MTLIADTFPIVATLPGLPSFDSAQDRVPFGPFGEGQAEASGVPRKDESACFLHAHRTQATHWIPACAGMTKPKTGGKERGPRQSITKQSPAQITSFASTPFSFAQGQAGQTALRPWFDRLTMSGARRLLAFRRRAGNDESRPKHRLRTLWRCRSRRGRSRLSSNVGCRKPWRTYILLLCRRS
jgi:hypothetical protein